MKHKPIPFNDDFLNIPICHRGLHSKTVAENSMEAFKLAKQTGFAIEIDIHKLSDGKFAVFHDKNLKRVAGSDVIIESLTSNELENYNLWDGQKIPLLDDVLKLVNGEVPLLIELKPEDGFDKKDLPALFEMLDAYNHYDMVAIQSFNPFIIKNVKKFRPSVVAGILSSYNLKNIKGIKRYVSKSLMLFNYMKADFISYDINYLPNKYVSKKKKKGINILAWVVNTKEKLELSKTVADNIIFENMEIFNENE